MAGSSTNNVRSVIELFCKILSDNKISDVRAETLRQGKFNRDVTTRSLWKILFNVVCFLDKESGSSLHLSEAGQVIFVKTRLQNWGYLSKSFAEVPSSLTTGSREILLALGWVIHNKQLFTEVIRQRTSPLHVDLLSFTQKIPVDAAAYHSFQPPRGMQTKERLQRQLLLCGKLKLKLRRLYSSQQELAQLRETIRKCTLGISVQPELNYLTPLEVFLLRYPESLGRMMNILEEDNDQLKRLLDWKEKEHVFWEWMDSVLTLKIQDQGNDEQRHEDLGNDESVFLDTPSDIGKQVADLRAHVRDFILGHEEEIETLEKLVSNKKISSMDVELANFQVERELFELSHRFSLYENGNFDIPYAEQNDVKRKASIHQPGNLSSNAVNNGRRKGQRNQRYVPQTTEYIKACKEAEVTESVQVEISALQQEVENLEQELKQIQINNLKRLQSITEQDYSSICILPRHFKQFLSS